MSFGEMHDRYLAAYRQYQTEVWCDNPKCQLHEDGTTVMYFSEYGQGSYEPEECDCGGDWTDTKPEIEENDDE